MHCTKISAEFEFEVTATRVHTPKNVALGYDVGKISADCPVCNQSCLPNSYLLVKSHFSAIKKINQSLLIYVICIRLSVKSYALVCGL